MHLELTAEETLFLRQVLQSYRSDLRMEINATDNPEYRRGLRHSEELANTILSRLAEVRATA